MSTATASPTAPIRARIPSKGAFFTRGTSRDRYARYTEEGAPYVDNMQRLLRKFETAKDLVPRPIRRNVRQAHEIRRDLLRLDRARRWTRRSAMIEAKGKPLDMHARARLPVPSGRAPTSSPTTTSSSWSSRTATRQLRSLIVNECGIDPMRLVPILHYDGTPITARFIARAIGEHLDALKVTPLRKIVS